MTADISTPRPGRAGVMVIVAVLHVLAVLGLIRAFAPDFSQQIVHDVAEVLRVTIVAPSPSPKSSEAASMEMAGAEGEAGRKAVPREAVAPRTKIAVASQAAPPVAGKGPENTSGALETGAGNGAGSQGSSGGAGGSGDGQGGGARGLERIAGEISSTRDYPKTGRKERSGDHAVIQMTVGPDGRASNCRILRASRDPHADAITCRLAIERFRFRPRVNAAGIPVTGEYQWRQRWWDPRDDKN